MATQQQVSVIGVFYDQKQAAAVRKELTSMGVDASHVRSNPTLDTAHPGESYEDKGFWESIKDMFTDDDSHAAGADYYAEAARRGGYVLTVTTDESQAGKVQALMQRYGAADAEKQVARWKQEGWSGYDKSSGGMAANRLQEEHKARVAGDEAVIQEVEENIEVGKRQVQRGGVRVVKRVHSRPVEEQVTLRDETIHVDRRAGETRNLTAEEAERAFADADQTIEVTETDEEAVVAKTARVTGEVHVGKDVQEKTQTVRDTVRSTEVEVEEIEGTGTTGTTTTKTRRD